MEVLIAYKMLQYFIFKVNIKILKKFDTVFIAQYLYYYPLILVLILYTYIDMKRVDDNHGLYFNDREDRWELKDALLQQILEYQKVTWDKYYILIVIIVFYILSYV